jgi:hypothetical protein
MVKKSSVRAHNTAVIKQLAIAKLQYVRAPLLGESEYIFAVGVRAHAPEYGDFIGRYLRGGAAYKSRIIFFDADASGTYEK